MVEGKREKKKKFTHYSERGRKKGRGYWARKCVKAKNKIE